MSKLKPGGPDRKGEGAGEGEGLRMITSQVVTPGTAPARPTLVATGTGPTYIVQSKQAAGHHHEMKSFAKLARSIAPAPPQQVQGLSGRTVHTSQPNIPSIISPSLGHGSAESLVSLNLVATTASPGLPPTQQTISVPVLPPPQQASVLQLAAAAASNAQMQQQTMSTVTNPTVIQPPGNTPSTLPINMLRSAAISGTPGAVVGNPVGSLQTFTPGFPSHLPRGTTTLSVPKSATALLRPGSSPALQIPNAGLNTGISPHSLPLARPSILQTIKTSAPQVNTRSPSPAIGGQPAPQVQPQDLSRTNFAMHGSITPVVSSTGTLVPQPMHITLNRLNSSDVAGHNNRTTQQQASSDADLIRSSLPYGAKLTPGGLGPQAKVVASQPPGQHIAPIKSVNLAASNPVMINSMNASLLSNANTIASTSAPLTMAKVASQRQLNEMTGLSVSSASIIAAHSLTSPLPSSLSSSVLSSSASSTSSLGSLSSLGQGQQQPPPPSLSSSGPATTLLTGFPLSAPSTTASAMSSGSSGIIRQELNTHPLPVVSQTTTPGAIIIPPDFPTCPPGSVIPMSSMSTLQGVSASLGSQADNRGSVMNPKGSMWLQHFVYHQKPIHSQPSQPGTANSLPFPSAQGGKAQTMATNQLAHAMSVASSNVRFNSSMMVVDHMRQHHQQQQQQQPPQMPLHSAFSTGTTTTSCSAEKTILTPHELMFSGGRGGQQMSSNALHYSSTSSSSLGSAMVSQHPSSVTGLSGVPVTNPSSSPRPSILRKRNSEAAGVVIRKPNFNLTPDSRCHSPPPRLDANISTSVCSPKTPSKNFSPASENSQSSTDTALSSNDAHTPTQNHHDKGKGGDADDGLDNGPVSSLSLVNNIPASPAVSHTGSLSEASPRKRARKQLLHANEELKDRISSSDEEMEISPKHRHRDREHHHCDRERERERERERDRVEQQHQQHMNNTNKGDDRKGEYTDDDGVRWVFEKSRPNFVLIHPDNISNKTRNNHFSRYSDVKPKEERRPTVNELCNQRGISQKVNGWKLYFTASQLEELMDTERDLQGQFADIQAALSRLPVSRVAHDEAGKIHEMSQANIQRCQLIQTQLTEARGNMIKTLDHQPRIQEILNKHTSKRPIKKKERT